MSRTFTSGSTRYANRASVGFTLIELLVVISIISLLVSILLPSLAAARRAAQRAGCQSNLRMVGMAGLMNTDDRNGRLPDLSKWTHPAVVNNDFGPYLGLESGSADDLRYDTIYTCQTSQSTRPSYLTWHRTYSMNLLASGTDDRDSLSSWQDLKNDNDAPYYIHHVQSPTVMSFYMDGTATLNAPGWSYSAMIYRNRMTQNPTNLATWNQWYPHNESLNVVHLDGHVSGYTKSWIEQSGVLDSNGHEFWSDR